MGHDAHLTRCHTRAKSKTTPKGRAMAATRFLTFTRRLLVAATLAGAAAVSVAPVRAEYPERPITIVVCFPAGGGTDIAARLIQPALQEALGKPVIIEN